MFTCGVRDFKLLFPDIGINVDSNFPALWENNPYIDRSITKGPGVEFHKVGYPIINNCNNSSMSFHMGFLFDMISVADAYQSLNMPIGEFTAIFGNGVVGDPDIETPLREKYRHFNKKFNRQRGDIYLTDKEKSYNLVKDVYGAEKYWVIAPGGKSDCTPKIWDWRRFQKVIDHFKGRIQFVSIGKSDHIVHRFDGVIDLIDKFNTDVRGLLPLVYHSEGCVSGVSFLLHLAAAVPSRINRERKPCVGIYGGREPTSFTAYCNHQILHTNGAFSCCDNGGCWQSKVIPLSKSQSNDRMCHHVVKDNGVSLPACMDSITAGDVTRAIEKYYDGNLYTYMPAEIQKPKERTVVETVSAEKELNFLASLSSSGGGEQSAVKIADILRGDGWQVNFHPWGPVHDSYTGNNISKHTFENGMADHMKPGLPLLFYGNDQVNAFIDNGKEIVDKSVSLIVGINYINGKLSKSTWLHKTDKLKTVVFQNTEKQMEFERDRIGFADTRQVVLFGAIDLNKYLEVYTPKRDGQMVILKHCKPDYRKYVTKKSASGGQKIHLWQKNIIKETDVKFYTRLLKDTKNIRFEFMEAHGELVNEFKGTDRMVFHKWDAMPVDEFLSKGHVYLYRTSNHWRDQYPRVVAEALAAGLPVLSEPRDGTKDRMDYGNIGFSCIDYDAFLYAVKLLQRKEKYRHAMGCQAKEWARDNLNPKKWLEVINDSTQ